MEETEDYLLQDALTVKDVLFVFFFPTQNGVMEKVVFDYDLLRSFTVVSCTDGLFYATR